MDALRILTFFVYITLRDGLLIGGTAYLVFWKGCSGWWWILSVFLLALAIRPSMWFTAQVQSGKKTWKFWQN